MRTLTILMNKDKLYVLTFNLEGEEKWTVTSYVLMSNLQEITYEWIEKGKVPPYRYT